MPKIFEGFKNFILRGNAVDLAVGVVIGTAFNSRRGLFFCCYANERIYDKN